MGKKITRKQGMKELLEAEAKNIEVQRSQYFSKVKKQIIYKIKI